MQRNLKKIQKMLSPLETSGQSNSIYRDLLSHPGSLLRVGQKLPPGWRRRRAEEALSSPHCTSGSDLQSSLKAEGRAGEQDKLLWAQQASITHRAVNLQGWKEGRHTSPRHGNARKNRRPVTQKAQSFRSHSRPEHTPLRRQGWTRHSNPCSMSRKHIPQHSSYA